MLHVACSVSAPHHYHWSPEKHPQPHKLVVFSIKLRCGIWFINLFWLRFRPSINGGAASWACGYLRSSRYTHIHIRAPPPPSRDATCERTHVPCSPRWNVCALLIFFLHIYIFIYLVIYLVYILWALGGRKQNSQDEANVWMATPSVEWLCFVGMPLHWMCSEKCLGYVVWCVFVPN